MNVGSTKTAKTPNHGLQMYDYTKGKYGWRNKVFGSSNGIEVIKLHENVLKWYRNIFDKLPSAMSYRNGVWPGMNMNGAFYLQCRNSAYSTSGDSETWYGKSYDGVFLGLPSNKIPDRIGASQLVSSIIFRPSSTRWWDAVKANTLTKQESLDYQSSELHKTINNGGWMNNFTHWHDVNSASDPGMKLNSYDDYFGVLKDAAGNNYVHYCSYGEASEYMMFRLSVKNVAARQVGNRVKLAVHVSDPFKNEVVAQTGIDGKMPVRRVNTPLSIIVDLTGTFLSGKNVKTTYGKSINLGDNKVLVEVPFPPNNEGVIEIEIFDNVIPEWLTLNSPVISDVNYSDNILTFRTDVPCYSSLFKKKDANNISLVSRQIDGYKTDHSIEIADITNVAIGVISETGITNLMGV